MALCQRRSDVLGLRVRPHRSVQRLNNPEHALSIASAVLLKLTAHAHTLKGAGDPIEFDAVLIAIVHSGPRSESAALAPVSTFTG